MIKGSLSWGEPLLYASSTTESFHVSGEKLSMGSKSKPQQHRCHPGRSNLLSSTTIPCWSGTGSSAADDEEVNTTLLTERLLGRSLQDVYRPGDDLGDYGVGVRVEGHVGGLELKLQSMFVIMLAIIWESDNVNNARHTLDGLVECRILVHGRNNLRLESRLAILLFKVLVQPFLFRPYGAANVVSLGQKEINDVRGKLSVGPRDEDAFAGGSPSKGWRHECD